MHPRRNFLILLIIGVVIFGGIGLFSQPVASHIPFVALIASATDAARQALIDSLKQLIALLIIHVQQLQAQLAALNGASPANTPSTDTTPPSMPAHFTATPVSGSEIDLSWGSSTDNIGVAQYGIFQGNARIALTSSTTYAVTNLQPGFVYPFYIVAYDGSGNVSPTTAVLQVSPLAAGVTFTGTSGGGGGGSGSSPAPTPTPTPAPTPTPTSSPDVTPPTISITSPAAGATLSGSATITASASDNVGVVSVTFAIDGSTVATDFGAPYAYAWNTSNASNGAHTLSATAQDAAGNQTVSPSVNVTVSNNVAPPSGAGPVVFFTDLIGGPITGGEHGSGVYLTIFGKRFGSSRGANTVKINGVDVARYVSWCSACSLAQPGPTASDKLDMIVVEPGAAVTSGQVVVNVGGVNSVCTNGRENCQFTVRTGNIYCVDGASGSDSNNGYFPSDPHSGSQGCWRTVRRAVNSISAGSWVYVHSNTLSVGRDPWAPNYCAAVAATGSGTQNSPVALLGYPGDYPTIGEGTGLVDSNGNAAVPDSQPCLNSFATRSFPFSSTGTMSMRRNWDGSHPGQTKIALTYTGSPSNSWQIGVPGVWVGGYLRITGTTNYNGNKQITNIDWDCTSLGNNTCWPQNFYLSDPGPDLAAETAGSLRPTYVYGEAFTVTGSSQYWTVADMRLAGPQESIDLGQPHTRMVNLDVKAPHMDDAGACIGSGGPITDSVIYGLYIHDCGNGFLTNNKYGHGIYTANIGNSDLDYGWIGFGPNLAIDQCIQNNDGHNATYDWWIHDSYIANCIGSGIFFQGVNPSGGSLGVKVWNNVFYHTGTGPGPIDGAGGRTAVRAFNYTGFMSAGTVQVYNNTVIDAGSMRIVLGNCYGADCSAFAISDSQGPSYSLVMDIENNIIVQPNINQLYTTDNGRLTGKYNDCFTAGASVPCPSSVNGGAWSNNISVDPQFTDNTSYSNMRLTAGSPAGIKTSGNTTPATFDADGYSRPQGSTPSIGAYEYHS